FCVRVKQRPDARDREAGAARVHLGRRQLVVRCHVEEFLAVMSPPGATAGCTGRRDPSSRSWAGVWRHVHFEPAGSIRAVRDQLTVGRKPSGFFREFRVVSERKWFVIADQRDNPQTRRRAYHGVEDESTVWRPTSGNLVRRVLQNSILAAHAAR